MHLITQSLLGSWNYLMSCREECSESAMNDFLDALNRVKKEPSQEQLNGINFEKEVYDRLAGAQTRTSPEWESGVSKISDYLKGSLIQVKLYRRLQSESGEFLVYGILDALKAGEIFDVKYSNKSFGSTELAGKYLSSPQHPTYFYLLPEAYKFTYLVSDGDDLYTEIYRNEGEEPFLKLLKEFMDFLKASSLEKTYFDRWEAL